MLHGMAWRVASFGDPHDALQLEELTWAPPKPGQVLVKVLASGVGLPDLLMTRGQFPLLTAPGFGLGEEVSGVVVATADDSVFATGDRIMGVTAFLDGWGGHAEYAYVNEKQAVRIPERLTDAQAAGFVIGFRTAHAALVERAPVRGGEVLAVLGAAGSTGVASIQLGKALGATVVAVAGSEEKLSFCAGIGADHLVNYRADDVGEQLKKITGGRGVDVILDPVGGTVAAQAVAGIARYGKVAVVGYASGSFLAVDPLDLLLRNYSAVGVLASGFTDEEEAAAYSRLSALAASGAITPPVNVVASFSEVPEVVAGLESAAPGKTVIHVAD